MIDMDASYKVMKKTKKASKRVDDSFFMGLWNARMRLKIISSHIFKIQQKILTISAFILWDGK